MHRRAACSGYVEWPELEEMSKGGNSKMDKVAKDKLVRSHG